MRFPWANIALIALFSFELVTGYLGLTHNNPEWIAAMHLHRIAGFAILALFVWKSRNILGSFKTRSNWNRSPGMMLGSILLLVLLPGTACRPMNSDTIALWILLPMPPLGPVESHIPKTSAVGQSSKSAVAFLASARSIFRPVFD